MSNRRMFLRQTASLGLFGWAGTLMPKLATAQTVGGGLASWAGATDKGMLAQAWAGRFTTVVPWILDPAAIMLEKVGEPGVYEVTAGQTKAQILPAGLPATTAWGYSNGKNGILAPTIPGPTFVATSNVEITVKWFNSLSTVDPKSTALAPLPNIPLPHLLGVDQTIAMQTTSATGPKINGVPIAIHHHGNNSAFQFDGAPDQWFTPERAQVGPGIVAGNQTTSTTLNAKKGLKYTYTNANAEASMHWYHDHADGMTRINAYAGLAGLYIVRDANEQTMVAANWLPTGEYEVPLVISDRVFDANGQLAYVGDVPAFNGWSNTPTATKRLQNPLVPGAAATTPFYPIPSTRIMDTTVTPAVQLGAAPVVNASTGNPVINPNTGFYSAIGGSYNPNDPFAIVAGQSATALPEFYGEVICVNGKAWPKLPVEPRQYRLRLLNASDSRFYNLRFEIAGTATSTTPAVLVPFSLIATDQGFLNTPVPVPGRKQLIGPGERMDVLIDFTGMSSTTKIQVLNDAKFPYPGGQAVVAGDPWETVMQIQVSKAVNTAKPITALPATKFLRGNTVDSALLPKLIAPPNAATVTRKLLLGEGCDEYGRIMPLLGTVFGSTGKVTDADAGTKAFHDAADINPTLGATEVWEFYNTTVDGHPMHMHLVKFRVLNRQLMSAYPTTQKAMANGWTGVQLTAAPSLSTAAADLLPAPDTEQGWKDTVVCPPGYVTRVVATFDKPGTYVYHCHILGHEEHDMMRWFQVI